MYDYQECKNLIARQNNAEMFGAVRSILNNVSTYNSVWTLVEMINSWKDNDFYEQQVAPYIAHYMKHSKFPFYYSFQVIADAPNAGAMKEYLTISHESGSLPKERNNLSDPMTPTRERIFLSSIEKNKKRSRSLIDCIVLDLPRLDMMYGVAVASRPYDERFNFTDQDREIFREKQRESLNKLRLSILSVDSPEQIKGLILNPSYAIGTNFYRPRQFDRHHPFNHERLHPFNRDFGMIEELYQEDNELNHMAYWKPFFELLNEFGIKLEYIIGPEIHERQIYPYLNRAAFDTLDYKILRYVTRGMTHISSASDLINTPLGVPFNREDLSVLFGNGESAFETIASYQKGNVQYDLDIIKNFMIKDLNIDKNQVDKRVDKFSSEVVRIFTAAGDSFRFPYNLTKSTDRENLFYINPFSLDGRIQNAIQSGSVKGLDKNWLIGELGYFAAVMDAANAKVLKELYPNAPIYLGSSSSIEISFPENRINNTYAALSFPIGKKVV